MSEWVFRLFMWEGENLSVYWFELCKAMRSSVSLHRYRRCQGISLPKSILSKAIRGVFYDHPDPSNSDTSTSEPPHLYQEGPIFVGVHQSVARQLPHMLGATYKLRLLDLA